MAAPTPPLPSDDNSRIRQISDTGEDVNIQQRSQILPATDINAGSNIRKCYHNGILDGIFVCGTE